MTKENWGWANRSRSGHAYFKIAKKRCVDSNGVVFQSGFTPNTAREKFEKETTVFFMPQEMYFVGVLPDD